MSVVSTDEVKITQLRVGETVNSLKRAATLEKRLKVLLKQGKRSGLPAKILNCKHKGIR